MIDSAVNRLEKAKAEFLEDSKKDCVKKLYKRLEFMTSDLRSGCQQAVLNLKRN